MATVSAVTIKYAARGARAARQADEKVRDSIKKTGRVARQEQGTIRQWMQRHKAALMGIGLAAAGAMAMIIKHSPALQAELGSARLAFSLFAMTVGDDVAPAISGVGEKAIEFADAFAELDPSIRKPISALGILAGVIGTVILVVATLETVVAGTAIGAALATAAGTAAGALGGLAALITGPVIIAVLAVIAIVGALYLAWTTNFLGIRDTTMAVIGWISDRITQFIDFIKPYWSKFSENVLAGNWGAAWETIVSMVRHAVPIALGIIERLIIRGKALFDKYKATVVTTWETMFDLATNAAKRGMNGLLGTIERGVNKAIKALNKVPGVNLGTVSIGRFETRSNSDILNSARSRLDDRFSRINAGEQSALQRSRDRQAEKIEQIDNSVTIESGAIQVRGGSAGVDERRLAEEISRRQDNSYSARGNL